MLLDSFLLLSALGGIFLAALVPAGKRRYQLCETDEAAAISEPPIAAGRAVLDCACKIAVAKNIKDMATINGLTADITTFLLGDRGYARRWGLTQG
jgi:hypothetical protein